MADGEFPGLVSKDRNVNSQTNPIFVGISDGVDLLLVNADGSINVSVGVGATSLGKAEDAVHASGDTGVMSLAVRNDAGTALAADGDYIPLMVNSSGALYVALSGSSVPSKVDDAAFTIATDTVSPSGYLADETAPDSVNEGDVGIARMTLDRKQLFVLVDSAVDTQRLTINANGEAEVNLQAHALTNANALPISRTNAANSELNPIFVQPVTSAVSGNEVHDFKQASAVAADTADNHDYTVTGTTFLLKKVSVGASGGARYQVQTGPVASLVTKRVGFLTGRQGDEKELTFDPPIEVPATGTGTVRVIVTNRQGQAQDLYSTIMGNDVA